MSTWCGVETYFGKIGDGKTFHVVRNRLLPALAEGRHVFFNIDVGSDVVAGGSVVQSAVERFALNCSLYLGKDVRQFIHRFDSPDQIHSLLQLKDMDGTLLQIPRGSRIILDEAQMLWPISGYRSGNELFFKLLSYSRHFDLDFCFITQNPALLDKRIISSSNELIMIKNLWFLSTFAKNRYQESHLQTMYSEPHSKALHSFDDSIFSLYRSSFTSVKRQKRVGPMFLILPLVGLVSLFGYIFMKPNNIFLRSKSHKTVVSSPIHDFRDSPIIKPSTASVMSVEQRFEAIQKEVGSGVSVSDSHSNCVYFAGPDRSGHICRS